MSFAGPQLRPCFFSSHSRRLSADANYDYSPRVSLSGMDTLVDSKSNIDAKALLILTALLSGPGPALKQRSILSQPSPFEICTSRRVAPSPWWLDRREDGEYSRIQLCVLLAMQQGLA